MFLHDVFYIVNEQSFENYEESLLSKLGWSPLVHLSTRPLVEIHLSTKMAHPNKQRFSIVKMMHPTASLNIDFNDTQSLSSIATIKTSNLSKKNEVGKNASGWLTFNIYTARRWNIPWRASRQFEIHRFEIYLTILVL